MFGQRAKHSLHDDRTGFLCRGSGQGKKLVSVLAIRINAKDELINRVVLFEDDPHLPIFFIPPIS
jgi:hypothetical protein